MFRWKTLLTVALVLAICGVASACPMCKDSIPNADGTSTANLPGGFNLSVYTMLVGFFSVLGLVSTMLVKGVRSTNQSISDNTDPTKRQN
jgi:hypothetical protein